MSNIPNSVITTYYVYIMKMFYDKKLTSRKRFIKIKLIGQQNIKFKITYKFINIFETLLQRGVLFISIV